MTQVQSSRVALEAVKERLKPMLVPYLAMMGIDASKTLFSCPNPEHQDSSPSCGIVPGTDHRVFHCFGCHIAGDIFTACAVLEGKPMQGAGFVTLNLKYLAHKFGIDMPEMEEPSAEELKLMDTYSAYQHAAMIVKNSAFSQKVIDRLLDLGWDNNHCQRAGIGSVPSYNYYIERMTKFYGHSRQFLREIDLDNKEMFNENRLLFTVRDENGSPCGFASRDLDYAEKDAAYKKAKEGLTAEEAAKLNKPAKYVNTHHRNPIYSKRNLLYLFDLAKRHAPPLYVLEGYPDGSTAQAGGMLNACAIGATAFTKEHLEMILGTGIEHIVFVLDADEAGEKGTERFVKMLEEVLGGHVGLRVEILVLPQGTDDPDAFIRSYGDLKKGVAAFKRLPKMDLFAWSLRKKVKDGRDPLDIAKETIPLIVNEPHGLQRMHMTRKLAEQTELDESGLWREVLRQVDAQAMGIEEEKTTLAKRISQELTKNPTAIESILSQARVQVENIEGRKSGYDISKVVAALDHCYEEADKNVNELELRTGWPHLDRALRGIPRRQKFISVPGKPNQCKSTLLQNLAWRLPEHNENAMTFYHSVDDAMGDAIARIIGSRFNVPSDWFIRPGYYASIEGEEFNEIHIQAKKWLRELMADERLIVADISLLPGTLPALEVWLRDLRRRHPSRDLIVMGDNFNLYDLPGSEEGENKLRKMSAYVKRLAVEYNVTNIFTCELPKQSLRPGVRPRLANIKGTSGVAYDTNANLGIYNDMKDRGPAANLTWDGELEHKIGPNGEDIMGPIKMPIVEVVIDKSKLSSFDGSLFYKFHPLTGRLDECGERDQMKYQDLASKVSVRAIENEVAMSTGAHVAPFSNA